MVSKFEKMDASCSNSTATVCIMAWTKSYSVSDKLWYLAGQKFQDYCHKHASWLGKKNSSVTVLPQMNIYHVKRRDKSQSQKFGVSCYRGSLRGPQNCLSVFSKQVQSLRSATRPADAVCLCPVLERDTMPQIR